MPTIGSQFAFQLIQRWGDEPVKEQEPKRGANDSPWYRLATLHGQPSASADEIAIKNRVTWNRWMAPRVPAGLKNTLIAKGWMGEELTPLTDDELRDIEASTGLLTRKDYNFIIDFSHTEFEALLFASHFIFFSTSFESATFAEGADFESAVFTSADFDSAIFTGRAHFRSATFAEGANFDSATFTNLADFGSATFIDFADFGGATFDDLAHFGKSTFAAGANFEGATFNRPAVFASATFADRVSFVNAEMRNATDFDDVTFARPPQCFNAKLHEGTTWHRVRWPAPPRDPELATHFIDAYERLKLEMDKLKKHGDELDFFALEQQCRRVVLGRWAGLPIALYGFLSDYGRSYTRPLLLLAATMLIGTVLFATGRDGCVWAPLLSAGCRPAIGLSFASMLSVLGKSLVRPEVFLALPDWLKAVSALQSILGLALLFLFGLGIRNRFRMK
jgi:uncharacterized protein YjbI with pentapeptide repeats